MARYAIKVMAYEAPASSVQARVCTACLRGESALGRFAERKGEAGVCTYCGLQEPKTVILYLLTEFIRRRIRREWCAPDKTNSYSSSAEGYEAEGLQITAEELFESEVRLTLSNPVLESEIINHLSDHHWCRREWEKPSPIQRRLSNWSNFKHFVKHYRRYTFWQAGEYDFIFSYDQPSGALKSVSADINESNLILRVPPGTAIWRLRDDAKREPFPTGKEFASPPAELATANRMSPKGIPMFYGADDFETAKMDLLGRNPKHGYVSGIQFRVKTELTCLDLTRIPSPPSYFSRSRRSRNRATLVFLTRFANDLSMPCSSNSEEPLEYVPTQVFTEYIRHCMKGPKGEKIDGIKYSSSRNSKPCWVIFASQAQCLSLDPWERTTMIEEEGIGLQLLEPVMSSMRGPEPLPHLTHTGRTPLNDENAVDVSDSTQWGNPFLAFNNDHKTATDNFDSELSLAVSARNENREHGDERFAWMAAHLHKLKGKNLACSCPMESKDCHCHGAVLLKHANL
jgi:RES domain/HEPN/RES N-terminal domain 1/Domain of unknown function (DUF4326)